MPTGQALYSSKTALTRCQSNWVYQKVSCHYSAVKLKRAFSSVWLERASDKGEVSGSSPERPTCLKRRGCSSVGRAPPLQGGCHGFESRHLHLSTRFLTGELVKEKDLT